MNDGAAEPKARARMTGIGRAIQIFDHLGETGAPLSAYAIAKAVGAPLSSVYPIINDLVARGMLARRDSGLLWLGPRLHRYGLAYAHHLDFLTIATEEMGRLRQEVNETVQICGRDDTEMVVLAMADGPGHFRVTSRVGTRVPLNWSASGKLLVGHLPHDACADLFRRAARPSPTGLARIDPEQLAREAHDAFVAGLSIQAGESDYQVACVAAPIRNPAGECVATFSVVLPDQKLSLDQDRYADAVRAVAARTEAALGWR